jgi:hypothetical protein
MLRRIHGTNFFHIKFLDRSNIKCQNGLVLPPAQVFYFNGQALIIITMIPNTTKTKLIDNLQCQLWTMKHK